MIPSLRPLHRFSIYLRTVIAVNVPFAGFDTEKVRIGRSEGLKNQEPS
jgi:hypothetical protein